MIIYLGDTPTAKATERIMDQIERYLLGDVPTYNIVREIIHRNLLANVLVSRLSKSRGDIE